MGLLGANRIEAIINIHIVTVAYGLSSDLLKLYDSANIPEATWHIFLHSRFPDVVAACHALNRRGNVEIYDYGVNRGLAKSWNEGLIEAYTDGADVALIANDDAYTDDREDVYRIAVTAIREPRAYFTQGMGLDLATDQRVPMRFALAAVNPIALRTVGLFDENLFPIYFEDTDWLRRAELAHAWAGHFALTVKDTSLVHAGSKSRWTVPGNDAQHQRTFAANREYYIKKWGGDQGQEQYPVPFNDPRFGLHIEAEARNAPYPGYNRTDQEIVTL